MHFFTSFYKSLSNLPWLKAQRLFPGRAWKYFFSFVFLFAVLFSLPFLIPMPSAVQSVKTTFEKDIPDFRAKLTAGKLSITNLQQPFVYRSDANGYIVVADTVSTSSVLVSNFATSTDLSSILITSDRLELRNVLSGDARTELWSAVPDFDLTKTDLANFLDQISNIKILPLIILGLFLLIYLGLILSQLYAILMVSLLVWLAAKLLGRDWTFRSLFTVGLYAGTLPALLSLVIAFFGFGLTSIYFLALLSFMLALVFTRDGAEVQD